MAFKTFSLFSDIRYYIKLRQELLNHLSKHPEDWSKFQQMFTLTVDKIYVDIFNIEKENITEFESDVYRGKRIFEKRYRHYFVCGEYITRSLEKPCGYAGDFKIIDDIYRNDPQTTGFERLWDNYFQQLAMPKAIRERKEDFKKIIIDFITKMGNKNIRIMNLASGPAREIKEVFESDVNNIFSNVIFDCYDIDTKAIVYAQQLLNNRKSINFFQKNAVRLALKKNVEEDIPYKYDLIYSTGLFDYFDERVATRLVSNLKKLLKQDGLMLISNARDKCSNPSAGWMEWVAEWYLIYRTEDEFKKIFIDAGVSSNNLKIMSQKSKIMQYCFARSK